MPLTRSRLVALAVSALAMMAGALPFTAEAATAEPYRIRRFALADDLRRNELPWTNEERLGFPARKPRDAKGVRLELCDDGSRYYSPGTLAINAMKRLDAYVEEGDPRQLEMARKHAAALRRIAVRRGSAWFLPYHCDYLAAGQRAPWFNAMAQGLAISLFVRLHRTTGEEPHLDAARALFRAFRRFDRSRREWVSYVDGARYLWLEHYPLSRPDHVLNAHLHAIFGIYELWQETRSPEVRAVLEGAITTMRDHAWRYRRPGGISLYGLRHRETIIKYHEIHVWQLRLLARISGERSFWSLADRLAGDRKPRGYVPGRPQVVRRTSAFAARGDGGMRLAAGRTFLAAVPKDGPQLQPGAEQAAVGDARRRRAAGIVAAPDFDGDAYADLAIGAPYADAHRGDAGITHVIHGGPGGLRGATRQVWSQASGGVADRPEWGDQLGWTLAHGDFDGDGFSDLATSARWEDGGARDAGAVHVLHGSPEGLTAERSQLWRQDSPGMADAGERKDQLGWALAAADFDGDGHADLAIGVPFEDRAGADSGVVHVLDGSPTGLRASGSQLWHQDSPGIADRAEAGDHFGKALAAGDYDGDGHADLAIGAPYESRGVNRSGVVHVLRGSGRGLTARGSQLWHQDAPGVRERSEERDQFGQSLAAGDFDGTARTTWPWASGSRTTATTYPTRGSSRSSTDRAEASPPTATSCGIRTGRVCSTGARTATASARRSRRSTSMGTASTTSLWALPHRTSTGASIRTAAPCTCCAARAEASPRGAIAT